MTSLILASSSPARLELLQSICIKPDKVIPADIDETPKKKELPLNYNKRIAQEKAHTVYCQHPNHYIIAADSIVVVGRDIIGKASTRDEARTIIKRLSHRRHRVITSVCVLSPEGTKHQKSVQTVVQFCSLSDLAIDNYLSTDEWKGKAGAFGIQGIGGGFIKKINGSYSNVVGLPLVETKRLLHSAGYLKSEHG